MYFLWLMLDDCDFNSIFYSFTDYVVVLLTVPLKVLCVVFGFIGTVKFVLTAPCRF